MKVAAGYCTVIGNRGGRKKIDFFDHNDKDKKSIFSKVSIAMIIEINIFDP